MRTFFAIWPPRDASARLWRSLAGARRTLSGVRWTPAERLHLTIRFVGDAAPDRLPELCRAASGARAAPAAVVRLAGAGVFPPAGPPRVLWIRAVGEALAPLHVRLGRGLAREGFPVEGGELVPHVTVGRVERRAREGRGQRIAERWRDAASGLAPVAFRADALRLVHSEPTPAGPRYRAVRSFRLLGRAGERRPVEK